MKEITKLKEALTECRGTDVEFEGPGSILFDAAEALLKELDNTTSLEFDENTARAAYPCIVNYKNKERLLSFIEGSLTKEELNQELSEEEIKDHLDRQWFKDQGFIREDTDEFKSWVSFQDVARCV